MQTELVNVPIPSASPYHYPIMIGSGILSYLGKTIQDTLPCTKIFLISNQTVFSLYGQEVQQSLHQAGFPIMTIILNDGEEFKNQQTLNKIYDQTLEHKIERKDLIVALGGGVIGDIAGYAAATILRGVPYIQIPTTLLAQVDSSVGGKVAVNHPQGKNLIGAFYQPKLVYTDITTLHTLPDKELKSGLAEVIKYSFIDKTSGLPDKHSNFILYLQQHISPILAKDPAALASIIAYSCKIKSSVVAQDEKESGLRAILNFGHTLGHAVEVCQNYQGFTHGEAVALGMHFALKLSYNINHLDTQNYHRGKDLLESYGLPIWIPPTLTSNQLFLAMGLDKKVESGKMRFVVINHTLGNVIIKNDIPKDIIIKTMGELYET